MSYPNGLEDAAPTYLSGHMADVVLSEFRPTRIKPDALRCVNVLLDELLWSIVKSARSLNTERLKGDGILRVIPAALGKEAVLEAEMELREYWKNSGDSREAYRDIKENQATFPIMQVFDVLRLKCEANSSLGGAEDEDAIAVEKAENRLVQVNAALPLEAFAPASLYLTAILEHVCGHIMSCVSRVVARDSSKTSASISDLYSALCEDQSLYNMVKNMTAFSTIETQHRAKGVQRKGSLSGSLASARSRAAPSPRPGYEPAQPSPTSASGYSRVSGDSSSQVGHSTVGANLIARPSIERKKVPPIIPLGNGTRQGSLSESTSGYRPQTYAVDDSALPPHGPHKRSGSGISDATKRAMAAFQDDNTLLADDVEDEEFEELMKAGSTMKVSLTPDRLRTFEVFAKDRNLRANRTGVVPAVSTAPSSFDASSAPPVPPLPTSTSFASPHSKPSSRSMTPRSSSPTNDGYATDSAIVRRPNSRTASGGAGRARLEPIPQMPLDPYGDGANVHPSGSYSQTRPRAATETRPTPPRVNQLSNDGASRKPGSLGTHTAISPLFEDAEFNDFADEGPKPKPAAARQPKVSQSARDLIAFLDEGPPEETTPLPRAGSTPAISSLDGLKKSGSRGFMTTLRGFGRSTMGDKGGRMGIGAADEFGMGRNTFGVRRQKSAHTLVSSTTVSSLPYPPISPIKPVPPRIALGEKDSIPGIGSRYRDGPPISRPSKVEMPKHDERPDPALPTPPASTESPLTKQYREGTQGLSPPTSPAVNGTRPPRSTRPSTGSSGVPDEYGNTVQGAHTRVAIDKVAEGDAASANGTAAPDEQLRLLQKLIRASGSIEECRLLVDSFLMQRGVRAETTPAPSPALPASTFLKPLPPNPTEDDVEEKQVMDWLLSSDTTSSATGIVTPIKTPKSKPRERTTSNGYDRKRSRERLRK